MKDRLEQRLSELREEFESGQRMLAELDAKQGNIRTTLLRISGAIQVLEEIIGAEHTPVDKDNGQHVSACGDPISTVEEVAA